MRGILLNILALLLAGGSAAFAARSPQEDSLAQAATEKALADLYRQVARMPVGDGVTAGQLLKVMDARDKMMAVLQRAEQIGGPRWIDQSTVQVQLEISGERVGHLLRQVVFAEPRKSPVSFEQVQRTTMKWGDRNFSATGAVSCAAHVPLAGVEFPGQWKNIGERARAAAVAGARQNAVDRGVENTRAVRVAPGKTVGQMLTDGAAKHVREWLGGRPISQIEFRQDMQVEVTLSADPDDFFGVVRDALKQSQPPDLPQTDNAWKAVRQEFLAKVPPLTGRWRAPATKVVEPRSVELPRSSPDWASSHLESLGIATGASNRLKAGLAAEADARDRLRASVEKLPLGTGVTLGEAAAKDERVARAVMRAMHQARVVKTVYPDASSAQVKLDLDLREVWEEIRR